MHIRREMYEHLRDWIVETELDRYRSGRVFEYMWAVMFGEDPISQPMEECDLLTCTPEVRTECESAFVINITPVPSLHACAHAEHTAMGSGRVGHQKLWYQMIWRVWYGQGFEQSMQGHSLQV